MKFLFSLILVVALGGVANAGMLSAVVGGAVAGSIAADGAKDAADKIVNSQRIKCLISIQDTNGKYTAIDYSNIKHIDPETRNDCTGPFWAATCRDINYYTIYLYDSEGSWSVDTFMTPAQIIQIGNQTCKS